MHIAKSPALLRTLTHKNLTWEINNRPGEIFLTFDDGPIPGITPEVLSILDKYKARATFFCVGDNAAKHHDVYRQIQQAGHATGNHTFHHLNGWKTTAEAYVEDVALCSRVIQSSLFRPPYGRIRPSVIQQLKKEYRIVMWSVLTGDYDRNLQPEKVLRNAIENTTSGSIVVFHDSLKAADNMLYALPRFLDYFSEKACRFSVIE